MSDQTNVEAPTPEVAAADADSTTTTQQVKEKAAAAAGAARTKVGQTPQPAVIALGALLTLGLIYLVWRILSDD